MLTGCEAEVSCQFEIIRPSPAFPLITLSSRSMFCMKSVGTLPSMSMPLCGAVPLVFVNWLRKYFTLLTWPVIEEPWRRLLLKMESVTVMFCAIRRYSPSPPESLQEIPDMLMLLAPLMFRQWRSSPLEYSLLRMRNTQPAALAPLIVTFCG